MDDVRPLWQVALADAKRSAFAALPQSEQDAAKAERKARRARATRAQGRRA